MTTNSRETKPMSETAEELKQRIERLERENDELRAENEKLKIKVDQGSLKEEIVLSRLYRFGKSKLDKAEVDDILKNLNGEYKNKIEDFIKNDKIEDLQKYLNGLIDSGVINKDQLVNNCTEKGIRLRDGRIFEDGKFGPQTFEAIKCLSGSENGDKDKAKDEDKDGNKDKGKDGKENYDYNNPIEGRDGRLYKAIKLASLDELPKDYKWPIPSNYEKGKEETYATVYHVIIKSKSANPYVFYGNGTCRSPLDDQIYDSKAIVEKLKNGRLDGKELYSDAEYAKKEIQKMGKLSFSDKGKEFDVGVKVHFDGKANKISLYLNENQNIYTLFSVGDIVDKNGNVSEDYFKKVILKQAEKKLLEQYYANKVAEQWKNRNEHYPLEWIFGKDAKRSYQLDKYFRTFANEIIKVEFKGFEGPYIKVNLKNGSNADYNKLKIHYSELTDKNGNFSNSKLKEYLKKKTIEIANEHFK